MSENTHQSDSVVIINMFQLVEGCSNYQQRQETTAKNSIKILNIFSDNDNLLLPSLVIDKLLPSLVIHVDKL